MRTSHFRAGAPADATRSTEIAKAEFDTLHTLFGDEKIARQVLNAAKRVSKKRTMSDLGAPAAPPTPIKKAKPSYGEPLDGATYEASLALPEPEVNEERLKDVVIYTNRAPLVLAFAVTVLKYTMPEQPLSSRLSLAQAVCSSNSQSKAKSIGLQRSRTAEEEGWGEGQPHIKVMNRQIRVMKRWGYTWKDETPATQDTDTTIKEEDSSVPEEPAVWGVDLEALKKSNGPVTIGERKTSELPIYRAESARAYLLKSFGGKPATDQKARRKKDAGAERQRNLGMLLGALDLLCQSWKDTLTNDELDQRAWGWYCSVRPEVKAGIAGWGGKGNVALADILELRRPA